MTDQLLSWCDDLHQVRGNVSQFQSTLSQLLTRTPSVKQFKELTALYEAPTNAQSAHAPQLVEKLRAALTSPQLKVAVRLKSLCEKGYLPFLLALSKINFKAAKSDRYVGYLLDYAPSKPEAPIFSKEHADSPKPDEPMKSYPPSLPPIENKSLLKLILTDKSLRQPADFLESQRADGHHDFNNNHNRKLSIKGRALVDLALGELLDEAFPKAHEDDLEYLRVRLTATHILAKLAFCYNLPSSLLHQVSTEASTDDKLVIFKHVFLAYVGGMAKDGYSFPEIKHWIGKLYQPLVAKLKEECEDNDKLKNVTALAYSELQLLLARVNSLWEAPTKKIRYEYEMVDDEGPYVYQLVVGHLKLGLGTGSSVMDAKHKAAYETFESKELRSQLLGLFVEKFRMPEKPAHAEPVKEKEVENDQKMEDPAGDSEDDYEPEDPTAKPEPRTTEQPKLAARLPLGPSGANKPPAGNQPRMPLPYGSLPPIPNMKKRGKDF